MKKATVSYIASGCAALSAAMAGAQGQPAIARLQDLTGNVLVSREAGMGAGIEAQGIPNGTRIITTANGRVVVVFDKGCRVEMRENQRFEVDNDKPCAALVPQSLAVAPPAAIAPVAGYVGAALLGGGPLLDSGGSGAPPTPVSPN